MKVEGSEAEREFFATGARLYLEVNAALEEFRRQGQKKCANVVQSRLGDIARACEMDWDLQHLSDYKYTQPEGNQELGRKLAVPALGKDYGGLYFFLELYRESGQPAAGATVCLWRQKATLAGELWSRVKDVPAAGGYRRGNALLFERDIPENGIADFEKYLNGAIDDFIAFISKNGGLKKYI